MDAEEVFHQLSSHRKFGSRFKELYARHRVTSTASKKTEKAVKHGWKSRFRAVLPWETDKTGLFILSKMVPEEIAKFSPRESNADEDAADFERKKAEASHNPNSRAEYLLNNHFLQSGGTSFEEVPKMPLRNLKAHDSVVDAEIESPIVQRLSPGFSQTFSGLSDISCSDVRTNGDRFDYLFNEHWNVYIPGAYSKNLDSQSYKFEEVAETRQPDLPSQEAAEKPKSSLTAKTRMRWGKLREFVKDKSNGDRFQNLFQEHFNVPRSSKQHIPGLKPDIIWHDKFRVPSESHAHVECPVQDEGDTALEGLRHVVESLKIEVCPSSALILRAMHRCWL